MNIYSPKRHWTELAENYARTDGHGFAPVMHPGVPTWFNEAIDRLQFRAVKRALAMAGVSQGCRVLDVGCGSGRWVRRYHEFGLQVTGVDATPEMLRLARENETVAPMVGGEAQHLPFCSESFDCVSDITVVQHIPTAEQPQALREMMRVIKPGGRLILMELIRGDGAHIFPRNAQDWIHQVSCYGGELIRWFPEEYLLLDRALLRVVRKAVGRARRRSNPDRLVPSSGLRESSATGSAFWALRHASIGLSAWSDPLFEKLLPADMATHGVFVFRK